jgi:hypothetical protein
MNPKLGLQHYVQEQSKTSNKKIYRTQTQETEGMMLEDRRETKERK